MEWIFGYALDATYNGGGGPEAERLLRCARHYRACGEHVAAGMLERDAAALWRMAHIRRAEVWAAARIAELAAAYEAGGAD